MLNNISIAKNQIYIFCKQYIFILLDILGSLFIYTIQIIGHTTDL